MRNLTLVIPTYNRPHLLATFVGYLQAERAECQIVIADSSRPEVRNANRALVQRVKLDLNYAEFPVETHPFDKFRKAVHMAKTSFCALCADDDLIVLDGVRHCLDALRSNPQAAVAQGYSFSFLCAPDGGMDLGSVLYFTPTIDEPTPLARVAKLFDRYQAATYGIYRTPVLQRIFDTMRPMKSILARELFGSALAAVEGAMIRVPRFSHGRSMDASESYEHWHPLEWFIKDSQGLFAEYHHYRDLMTEQVLQRHDNDRDPAVVRRVLDLIHLRYFARHTPGDALRFIIGQRMASVPIAEYWQQPEIQVPLYEAARVGTSAPDSALVSAVKSRHGENRTYNLHPAFVAPLGLDPPNSESIDELLQSLHSYRLEVPDVPSKRAPRSTRTQMPPKTITVSILLCNYNDARFLPDSLGAVCNQTRLPEEFIVLDDGSTDDSLEIIEGFARRHPFIRVLKNETNRGLLYSINRALKEARCDFIVWAAADDRLMPNFVERNIQCLRKHPTAGISFSRLAVFRDGSDEIQPFTEATHGVAFDFGTEPQFLSPADLRERLQRSYLWISANAVMASRTALVRAGGFDPELRWHADYFGFWVLALRHGACSIPETLALMRQREQTYSSAGMARHKEQRATLGRLADKLTMGGWRDIGVVVLRSPSLLSPFGGAMLATLLRKPRRWPFAVTYGLWWANHQWGQRPGIVPRMGSRLARTALRCVEIMLTKIGRLVRWAGRAEMRDFTLIVPTHNRRSLFAALLSYLETEKVECHVLVLDSSRREILTANRARVAASNLDIEFAEFTDISVNEKWRQGAHKVSTPYCALCADDDLVVLEGVRRCLGVLRTNSKASAVQGHSFTFLPRPDGDIELNNIVYFTPTLADATPLKRVARLFEQYQAPSYAAFRTPVLQRIFDAVQPITRILARELLSSALTAIEGQIIRIPDFSYGRSMGPSADYEHWHPLEWFSKTPDGLFAEYLRYRELMAAAVIGRSDNDQKPDDIRGILDLISLRYLVKHAPDSALQFIAEQQMSGVDFADYWPSHEIHLPLYAAAGIGPAAVERPLRSIKLRGHRRSYVLYPSFYAPGGTDSPRMDKIVQLIDVLDRYRPESVEVSTPKAPHEGVPA